MPLPAARSRKCSSPWSGVVGTIDLAVGTVVPGAWHLHRRRPCARRRPGYTLRVIFLEDHARLLQIVHAILGAATVAVATHLVVWTRTWWRGSIRRVAAVRWFGMVGFALYLAQFALGNLLYPAYKVRVRAEYLDEPAAVRADAVLRREARQAVAARAGVALPEAGGAVVAPVATTMGVARLFDVKEHWAALGVAFAGAICFLLWRWEPARDGPATGRLVAVFALVLAVCAWVAGVLGLYTSTWRNVGTFA